MKKLLLVGALAVGASACAPDVVQDPPPNVVVAQFDPSGSPAVVPSPNDLAFNSATGLVAAPINPAAPAAEQEFTRDYVNTLNGFPTTLVATTKIADLDKNTITPNTVRFVDLLAGTPIARPRVETEVLYNEETDILTIRPKPPATAWPKGGRYMIALVGGENGLKGTNGQPVVGSAVWGFASSEVPLVTCEDLTAPDCLPTTDIIPSDVEDPAARIRDQTATALRLETLRRAYRPLLDAVATQGVNREDIVLLWTFRVMDMPEPTFNPDPTASVVPFPNDLALKRNADGSTQVNLPPPPENASELQKALIRGLNTLDGFSTTSAIVSENSATLGTLETGSSLDAANLSTAVKFFNLTGTTTPNVRVCLNCAGTAQSPQQLQIVPQAPLDEKTTYAAVMTTDLKDVRGRPLAPPATFALLRLSNPLIVEDRIQVSALASQNIDTVRSLEAARQSLKPMFDALEAKAQLPRSKIALAWAFTTQSTVSTLARLHALPETAYAQAGIPGVPLGLDDKTTTLLAGMGSLPKADIGKIYQGTMILPFALTGEQGTLNPTQPRVDRVPFLLVLPTQPAPDAKGWPVAIFSHGLRGSHGNVLTIANELAKQGYAAIAYDSPYHGERSSCVGVAATIGQSSDDAACANPQTQRCETSTANTQSYGRCVARDEASRATCTAEVRGSKPADIFCSDLGQGRCLADGKCEGGSFLLNSSNSPAISGWNFINPGNLFATRDNFRQHSIDLGQAVRVLKSPQIDGLLTQLNGGTATALDETNIVYLGQSLGGILGTLSTSVASSVGNVVLNVPGGDLTGILLTSPAFKTQRDAFLLTLSNAGIKQGTPEFDQFFGLARMILDPADPVNYSYFVENGAVPPTREALVQYITNDEITPNPTTQAILNAANNRVAGKKMLASYLYETATPTPGQQGDRHGFLLNFKDPAVTTQAQMQAVQFLKTGVLP